MKQPNLITGYVIEDPVVMSTRQYEQRKRREKRWQSILTDIKNKRNER